MSNFLIPVSVGFGLVVMLGLIFWARACDPPHDYVNRSTANIQRVNGPEDHLMVFHDALRGVTCYQDGMRTLACVPDVWLKPDASR
jgi:hypothetical protein